MLAHAEEQKDKTKTQFRDVTTSGFTDTNVEKYQYHEVIMLLLFQEVYPWSWSVTAPYIIGEAQTYEKQCDNC